MTKYVDQIQDRLRRAGYPLFEPQQLTQLVVPAPGQAPQQEPQIQQTVSWLITRSDRTAGFILGPSTITYHTTHYRANNEFIPELLRGLATVHEVVSLDHISRLGLRYLDAVLPRAGETTEQYLVSGLHGIAFNAVPQQATAESVFTTETHPLVPRGTLIVKVYRANVPRRHPSRRVDNNATVQHQGATRARYHRYRSLRSGPNANGDRQVERAIAFTARHDQIRVQCDDHGPRARCVGLIRYWIETSCTPQPHPPLTPPYPISIPTALSMAPQLQ
jgi:uncharacterized protein (TIGR04255 family)